MSKLEALVWVLTSRRPFNGDGARVKWLSRQLDVDAGSAAKIEDALLYATHKGYV